MGMPFLEDKLHKNSPAANVCLQTPDHILNCVASLTLINKDLVSWFSLR